MELTATALNGVAIAMMATGFIAPIVALSYGVLSARSGGFATRRDESRLALAR